MAELNTAIPLQARMPEPPNLLNQYLQAQQLRGLAGQQKLQDLQLRQAEQQEQERVDLRDIGAKSITTDAQGRPTLNKDAFVTGLMPKNPLLALKTQQQFAKDELELGKAKREKQKADMEMHRGRADYMARLLGTATDQESYDRAKAQFAEDFPDQPINAPAVYDPQWVGQMRMQSMDIEKQLSMMLQQAKQEEETRQFGIEQQFKREKFGTEQEQEQRKLASQEQLAREGHAVSRAGHATTLKAAQIRAAGEVGAAERAGQKVFETEKMKLAAQREFEPLGGEAAKSVSAYNAMINSLNVLGEKFEPEYTGPIRGRYGALKQLTGNIADQEIEFRRLSADIQDALSRARSGAAIPPSELLRLERLAPDVKDQPNVFKAKLEGFGQELERQRDERLRTERTGRGSLPMPRVQPVPGAPTAAGQPPAAAAPGTPRPGTAKRQDSPEQAAIRQQLKATGMTDADIDAALGR